MKASQQGSFFEGLICKTWTSLEPNLNIMQVTIDVSGESLFGEYVLVAGNDHGVSDQLIELRRPATDIRSYTSGAPRRTSYPQSAAFSSFVVFAIYVLRRL